MNEDQHIDQCTRFREQLNIAPVPNHVNRRHEPLNDVVMDELKAALMASMPKYIYLIALKDLGIDQVEISTPNGKEKYSVEKTIDETADKLNLLEYASSMADRALPLFERARAVHQAVLDQAEQMEWPDAHLRTQWRIVKAKAEVYVQALSKLIQYTNYKQNPLERE